MRYTAQLCEQEIDELLSFVIQPPWSVGVYSIYPFIRPIAVGFRHWVCHSRPLILDLTLVEPHGEEVSNQLTLKDVFSYQSRSASHYTVELL